LPLWLHTSFAQAIKKKQPKKDTDVIKATTLAMDLVAEYDKEKEFLKILSQYKRKIDTFQVAAFEDPKKFDTQWNTFKEDLLAYFVSSEFITRLKNANNLAKLAAVSVMRKLVDTFDVSIKAMKGSQLYEDTKKVSLFEKMLKDYNRFFEALINIIPEGSIPYGITKKEGYIRIIDDILNKKTFTKDDLMATDSFNVGYFTIGSGTDLDYKHKPLLKPTRPNTLEDIFTLIHQNLLVIINVLAVKTGITDIDRPELLRKIEKEFLMLQVPLQTKQTPSLTGIELDTNALTLFYNLPLRQHSIQYILKYNKKQKNVEFTTTFFGANEKSRWEAVEGIISLMKAGDLLNVVDQQRSITSVTFSIEISNEKKAGLLKNSVQMCINSTYTRVGTDFLLDKNLLDQDLSQKKIVSVCLEGLMSIHDSIRKVSRDLIMNLLDKQFISKKSEELELLIDGIIQLLKKKDSDRIGLFKLIKGLMKRGIRIKVDNIYSAIITTIKEEEEEGIKEALAVLILLIRENLITIKADDINKDDNINKAVEMGLKKKLKTTLVLLKVLVEQNYNLKSKAKAVVDLVLGRARRSERTKEIELSALVLLQSFIKKGWIEKTTFSSKILPYYLKTIEEGASEVVKQRALDHLILFMEEGVIDLKSDDIKKAITQGIEDGKIGALFLISRPIEKGVEYDEILKNKEGILDVIWDAKEIELNLLMKKSCLVLLQFFLDNSEIEKKDVVWLALFCVRGLESDDIDIQEKSKALLRTFVEKGFANDIRTSKDFQKGRIKWSEGKKKILDEILKGKTLK